jgi:hypothetical protein
MEYLVYLGYAGGLEAQVMRAGEHRRAFTHELVYSSHSFEQSRACAWVASYSHERVHGLLHTVMSVCMGCFMQS